MSANSSHRIVRFSTFELNLHTGELRKRGQKVKLQEQPLQVLAALLERPGEMVTREELRSKLWPEDTFVDFDHGLNAAIKRLRDTLGESAETPIFVETVPRRGYRFIGNVEKTALIDHRSSGSVTEGKRRFWSVMILLLSVFAIATAAVAWWHLRQPRAFVERGGLVLGEVENRTGDPVFDDTLRQALAIQLEQSPHLSVVPDQQVRKTLPFVGRKPGDRLSPDVTRNICARTGSKAMITGTISPLGSQYVIDLDAVNCESGDLLAREQVQAARKEDVLRSIGQASTDLRLKLGESVRTIQRFNTPIQEATTSSLEALKAYSTAVMTMINDDPRSAMPLYQRAIDLDPKFAMAYLAMGGASSNIGEYKTSNEYTIRAYKLRDRVSEPERFAITSTYDNEVLGNLQAGTEVLQVWAKTYPRASLAHIFLYINFAWMGMHEEALAESQAALRQVPVPDSIAGGNLMMSYIKLNRINEAKTVYDDLKAHGINTNFLRGNLYLIAFLQHDAAAMKDQLDWSRDKPGEDFFIGAQADTEASAGHLAKARDLTSRAVELAKQYGQKEGAAQWELEGSLREAEFGNSREAVPRADEALKLAPTRDVRTLAALAYARSGERARAKLIAEQLAKEFPQNTMLQKYWLPSIRAATDLRERNATAALEALEPAKRYELGTPPPIMFLGTMYPAYLRGEAYLMNHQGAEAEREFEKILQHPGVTLNFSTGLLARLGLARSYTMQGNIAKARSAYSRFLEIMKGGDESLSVRRSAEEELRKL